MPDLIREQTVKARKAHGCMTCNTTAIQAGETYCRTTYVYDGRIYDWVQCTECSKLVGEVYRWAGQPDEGVGEDTFAEWASESATDERYGEAATAYLARIEALTDGSER